MAQHTSTSRLLTLLLQSFRSLAIIPSFTRTSTSSSTILPLTPTPRHFSTTSPQLAKKAKSKGDPRIALIRYHLQHPKKPRPLRLSRMRSLRHWTIHRAWLLARRKKMATEEGELMRMYQSMHSACEELRTMDPSGSKDSGRLYRIAMEKKGIFKHGGVPIEYARLQTDTPGKEPWNHGWTR